MKWTKNIKKLMHSLWVGLVMAGQSEPAKNNVSGLNVGRTNLVEAN